MAGAVSKARTPIKRIQFALMGALVGLVIGIVGVFAVQNLGFSAIQHHRQINAARGHLLRPLRHPLHGHQLLV